MTPEISIILPVYNTEKYIRRCLDSIACQMVDNYEVIVVNDASPDHAMDIVREYAEKDPRYVIVDKQENEGQMMARKSGYTIARGDYLMFCDSDDYLSPNALKTLLETIKKEDADIAVSGYIYVPVSGCEIEKVYHLPYGNDREAVYQALLSRDLAHNLWGNLYRRELFTNYKYPCYMKLKNGEDRLLFYEVADHVRKVVTTDEPLYYYCQNLQSSTQERFSEQRLRDAVRAGNLWMQFMYKRQILPEQVTKEGIFMLYNKLKQNYNREIVLEGYSALKPYLSFKTAKKYLGSPRACDLWLLLHVRDYSKWCMTLKKWIGK